MSNALFLPENIDLNRLGMFALPLP